MSVWMKILKNIIYAAAASLSGLSLAQPAPPQADSIETLRREMQELRQALSEIRDELAGSRRESEELRKDLQNMRDRLATFTEEPTSLEGVKEDQQLLAAKVEDQYQSKVASGSKYRVRLSGLALLNVFTTRGAVDNLDLPEHAERRAPGESGGSFGATVRQSQIGLEVFGPEVGSAKSRGSLKFDFFGGFPSNPEGVTAGLVRLRTATLSLDWKNTSITGGQDTPFFTPLSPTSLASTAYPALAGSGNLWTWTPQVFVEHRLFLSENSRVSFQGGILDPLTGELPSEYDRTPTAGERSRSPAYATRVGWQRDAGQRSTAVGAGAYFSRQNWGFERRVNSWAATADWELPLGPWLAFSGEMYRGRALAGLGGGVTPSVLFSASQANTGSLLPLESAGGWAQLKLKPVERLEFNAAFGEDRPFRRALGSFLQTANAAASPSTRNASGFLNVIYQLRSNLLLSLEYRRLWTFPFAESRVSADHVNLGAGILF